MLRQVAIGAVALAALLPAQSQAQEQQPAELVLYPKGNFKGAGYSVAGASQSMRVFTVRSVKIPEGQAWELCSGNTFSGCKEFQQSDPAMVMNVRSVRPVAPKITTVGASVGSRNGQRVRRRPRRSRRAHRGSRGHGRGHVTARADLLPLARMAHECLRAASNY